MFNNIEDVDIIDSMNYWNTILSPGKNIVRGNRSGGNYWASPNGTGFS
ncbi:MAG: NosD domain-containing protein [Ignisphaera sp.]